MRKSQKGRLRAMKKDTKPFNKKISRLNRSQMRKSPKILRQRENYDDKMFNFYTTWDSFNNGIQAAIQFYILFIN